MCLRVCVCVCIILQECKNEKLWLTSIVSLFLTYVKYNNKYLRYNNTLKPIFHVKRLMASLKKKDHSKERNNSWLLCRKKQSKEKNYRVISTHQKCSDRRWLGVVTRGDPRPATLLSQKIWLRCFPVNFAKFFKYLFYRTLLVAVSAEWDPSWEQESI